MNLTSEPFAADLSAHFNRPPRIQAEPLIDSVELPEPPVRTEVPATSQVLALLPALSVGLMALVYLLRPASSGADPLSGLLFTLPMVGLGFVSIGVSLYTQRHARRQHTRQEAQNWLEYVRLVEQKRARLQAAADVQRVILETNNPETSALLDITLKQNLALWYRRPEDADFTCVRIGRGDVLSTVQVTSPSPDGNSELLGYTLAIAEHYRYLRQVPVLVNLREDVSIGVGGQRSALLRQMRTLICQLAVAHTPQELRIYLVSTQAHYGDWRWMEWLPHVSIGQRGGAADLLAFKEDAVRTLMGVLAQEVDSRQQAEVPTTLPHLLLIVDGIELVENEPVYATLLRQGDQVGASTLCLASSLAALPGDCRAIIEVDDSGNFRYARTGADGFQVRGMAEQLSTNECERIARALSSVTLRAASSAGRIPKRVDFLDMYGVQRVEELPINDRWARLPRKGVLPYGVPLGRESLTVNTMIDLNEDMHGPHGMLAGTTGSGKSELLQTLICSLVLEHHPHFVSLLLIDFKGGATFGIFADLPHTAGIVTNLNSTMARRALEAIKAETTDRQRYLESIKIRDITQYHDLYVWRKGAVPDDFRPLPHLFIIVDEFAQLAREMPDFMSELVRTVQVGRSLGLHLLLGTQSPMNVVTDEMNANLQFRICLRVQTLEASRAMLRRPDAAYLPTGWPGRGYFQVGTQGVFKQFQAAYVGAEYMPPSAEAAAQPQEEYVLDLIDEQGERINLLKAGNSTIRPHTAQSRSVTIAKAIAEYTIEHATQHGVSWTKRLLLPPLLPIVTLGQVFERLRIPDDSASNQTAAGAIPQHDQFGQPITAGSVPIGILDDIHNRTQHPLWLHFNSPESEAHKERKTGHVLIMGGAGTGKTVLLQTLALSLAALNAPNALHLYMLSFTGQGLDELSQLPHAARVIYGTQPERIRRLFDRLLKTLNERQGGAANSPRIIVFIDQYEQLRETQDKNPEYMEAFTRLLNEGRAFGIYLVVNSSSPNTLPDRLRSLVEQRIALRLGEMTDYASAVGRVFGMEIESVPGRGFYRGNPPLLMQAALPDFRLSASGSTTIDLIDSIQQVRNLYPHAQGGPLPIEALPKIVPFVTLPVATTARANLYQINTPLGRMDDDPCSVFELDWWNSQRYFMVAGPVSSGKSSVLRTLIRAATRQRAPEWLHILLIDFRDSSLRSLRDLKHVLAYVTDDVALIEQLAHLRSELSARRQWLQAQERTLPEAVRNGKEPPPFPALLIVIEDCDSLREYTPLLERLAAEMQRGSNLGLYVWVTGAYDSVIDPVGKQMVARRSGFSLVSSDGLQTLTGRAPTAIQKVTLPEGRAFYVARKGTQVVQFAFSETSDSVPDSWPMSARATWAHPAAPEALRSNAQVVTSPYSSAAREAVPSSYLDVKGLMADLGLSAGTPDES